METAGDMEDMENGGGAEMASAPDIVYGVRCVLFRCGIEPCKRSAEAADAAGFVKEPLGGVRFAGLDGDLAGACMSMAGAYAVADAIGGEPPERCGGGDGWTFLESVCVADARDRSGGATATLDMRECATWDWSASADWTGPAGLHATRDGRAGGPYWGPSATKGLDLSMIADAEAADGFGWTDGEVVRL